MTFDGAIIRRSPWSGLVAVVSFAALVASGVAAACGVELAALGFYAFYPLGIGAALHLGWVGSKPRAARIDVSGAGVSADGKALRSRLRSARIIPRKGQSVVELRRRLDVYPLRIAVATDEDARTLVRALGLDPREGTTRFRPPMSAWVWPFLIAIWFACSVASSFFGPLEMALVVPMTVVGWRLFRQTVTIGHDGILIEGFPRRRFVPYASIGAIHREVRQNQRGPTFSRGFWLELRSGERIFLSTLNERLREGMLEGDHLFDAAHTAHALARHAQAASTDVLMRGGRTTSDWLRQLKTVGEARYRVAAVPDDHLLSVLRDPNADTTARAAAAICLAGAGEEARVKVRVAVEDIASPELRAAALAALSDDEDALMESLEALV